MEEEQPKWRWILEPAATVGLILLLVVYLASVSSSVNTQAVGLELGIPVALFTGVLISFLVYFLQIPRFSVTLARDEYSKRHPDHYVHLKVRNTSWGFLGGGTAINCRGTIEVAGKTYRPKWASGAEPLLAIGTGKRGEDTVQAGIPQQWLMDRSRAIDLPPGGTELLDVAVKVNDDERCWVHEPENYLFAQHKNNPLSVGSHAALLTLRCTNRPAWTTRFTIHNGKGIDPAGLTLELPDPS